MSHSFYLSYVVQSMIFKVKVKSEISLVMFLSKKNIKKLFPTFLRNTRYTYSSSFSFFFLFLFGRILNEKKDFLTISYALPASETIILVYAGFRLLKRVGHGNWLFQYLASSKQFVGS